MIVFFPQWQGTGEWTPTADGCRMIAGQVAAERAFVPVLLDPRLHDGKGGFDEVLGREAIEEQARHARPLLSEAWRRCRQAGDPVIVVGGDCSIIPVVLEAAVAHQGDVQLLWIDAHPDLNTARSSPSGHAHGMALRLALGEGCDRLASRHPAGRDAVTLVGARTFDPEERSYIDRHGIPIVGVDSAARMAAAVGRRLDPDRPVHLHIDLDSLDPDVFRHVNYPVPGGLSLDGLMAVIGTATERCRLVSATVTEYAPKEPCGGMDAIRAILGDGLGVDLASRT